MSPLKKRGFDVSRIAAIVAAFLALLALLEEDLLGLSPLRLVALAVLVLAVSILV